MKPIDFLLIEGEKIGLYTDFNSKILFGKRSVLLVPLVEFVDVFSIRLAKKIAKKHSLEFTKMRLLEESSSETKAFAVFLSAELADYYEENRKTRGTEKEYEEAKNILQNALIALFKKIEDVIR